MQDSGRHDDATGLWVADATWPEVEHHLQAGRIGILPIGAASKEHGPHLPLNADFLQAEWLARQLMATLPVAVWPTLSYGYYPVFVEYPGSISLNRQSFEAIVSEILGGIFHAGSRRVALLNTGISTIVPLEAAIAASAQRDRITLINVYSGPCFKAAVDAIEEQAFGGHADEVETSILLAIAPERVDMNKAVPAPQQIKRGIFNRSNPEAPNYSSSGVNGDPSRATAAKGEHLLKAMFTDVSARVSELL